MPTVILRGGLGNQLFQYAVGRALSLRTATPLRLETSWFSRTPTNLPSRSLHLRDFQIDATFIQEPVRESLFRRSQFKLFDWLRKISPEAASRLCRVHKDHSPHEYSSYVPELPGDTMLLGYYQSERYFQDAEAVVREEISFPSTPTGPNQRRQEQIDSNCSVAVHVRRGDYQKQGWLLPLTYYRNAIHRIQRQVGSVELFFFSDETHWVQKHLNRLLPASFPRSSAHIVAHNSSDEVPRDLALMTRCHHNIIANSTLSWWGAWLNNNEEQMVFAPNHWLRSPVSILDIIPERWTVVEWSSSQTA